MSRIMIDVGKNVQFCVSATTLNDFMVFLYGGEADIRKSDQLVSFHLFDGYHFEKFLYESISVYAFEFNSNLCK